MSKPPFSNLDELFQRLLDDQIRPDEMKRLQEAMLNDPQVQDYYFDSIFASTVMRRCSQMTSELSESDLVEVLLSDGQSGWFRRFARYLYSVAAVLIIGALITVCLSLYHDRDRGPAIGVLADTYEVQWRGAKPTPGESLYARTYDLREGVAKMELDKGTSLVLEAPCKIDLKSFNDMILRSGRLTVLVSPQVKGFRVRTSTAIITDLGTEFGVLAQSDGSTEAHVLKGHISVALDPNRTSRPSSVVVQEGQASAVDKTGQAIQTGLTARAELFLLKVPSHSPSSGPSNRLNLADLVGGGNGRGNGRMDWGIDLKSGQAFRYPATKIEWTREKEFWPVSQFNGIDGVFVPNGALGPVVISSTGLTFSQCPRTVGSYFGGPANSSEFLDLPSQQMYPARLDGLHFGTSKHPALILHPNAGITFDLDQLRQSNPRIRMDRFTAICGIPKKLPHTRFSDADAWVLLDGVLNLRLRFPADRTIVEKIDVPISAQTQFLTLVTTCSGLADFSWIFFGDPFLEPAETTQMPSIGDVQ